MSPAKDLSQYSDDELMKIAAVQSASDEELMKAAGIGEAPVVEQPKDARKGFVDAFTKGLLDAATGFLQAAPNVPPGSGVPIPESVMGPGRQALAESVDKRNADFETMRQENPVKYYMGQLLGQGVGAAPLMALPGAGATIPARAGIGAITGALQGATQPVGTEDSRLANTGLGGLFGGAFGAGTGVMGKGINAVKKGVSDVFGIPTTRGEDVGSPFLQKMDSWLEALPGWTGGISKFRKIQNEKAEQAVKGFFAQYVVDPTLDTTAAMKEADDAVIGQLYDTVRANGAELPPVVASNTKNVARNLISRYPSVFEAIQDTRNKGVLVDIADDLKNDVVTIPGTPAVVKPGKMIVTSGSRYNPQPDNPQWFKQNAPSQIDQWRRMFKGIEPDPDKVISPAVPAKQEQVPREVTFEDLWELRKGLGQAKEHAMSQRNKVAAGQFDQMYAAVSRDLETMFSKADPKIGDAFKAANHAYKQYSVKFDALRAAFDKSEGTTSANEFFSPKTFSTNLKKMINDPKKADRLHWTDEEIQYATGLANVLQKVKRAGQFMENPPTGNRWGVPLVGGNAITAGALIGHPLAAVGAVGGSIAVGNLIKFLTTNPAGKRFALAAAQVPAGSEGMDMILRIAVREMTQAALTATE